MFYTDISQLGFLVLFVLIFLTITLPRKYALVPILICTLYMTLGQRIVVLNLDFTIFRILLAMSWIRVIIRRDINSISFNKLDKLIIWWCIIVVITGGLLDKTTPLGGNLQHRLGQVFNALTTYFLFRLYIDGLEDIRRIIRILSIIIIPLAFAFLIEKVTGRNMFAFFGAVPEITQVRYGRFRCQGPFAHPILGGTLGVTLMPFFLPSWFEKGKEKFIAFLALVSSCIIMVTSASSGPLLAFISAVIALFVWPLRNRMRAIRWCILLGIITLHVIMTAPVWYLIARISYITGGTGWGRSKLIDYAIEHFSEWWLIGTTKTSHWDTVGVLPNPDMMDITNQYILEGVYGGLPRMILFITIIVVSFKGIGHALQELKDEPFAVRFLPWALGTSLFAHSVGFISVAYFDQLIIVWYLLLAMISIMSNIASTSKATVS